MQRGERVVEIATGRVATIVFSHPNGTADHSEPWAKVMFGLGNQGVSFAARDLTELRLESEVAKCSECYVPISQQNLHQINDTPYCEACFDNRVLATAEANERTVAAFELNDLGVEHAQYFQGAGVAFTSWDEVFVGVGDTARDAAEDAVNNALMVVSDISTDVDAETGTFDNERSAHVDCEHDPRERTTPEYDVSINECPCHNECELQHYAALYVRYE